MKDIIIIGGGGHCSSVVSAVTDYQIAGIIDSVSRLSVLGIKVLGGDDMLPSLFRNGIKHAHVAVGDNKLRETLQNTLVQIGFELVNIIDKTASVCGYAALSRGIFVGKRAVINSSAKIGNGCIINTGAIIEHDCMIGDYVHCAPGCVICGGVVVGDGCSIGANSTIVPNVTIPKNTIIGAGSTVIKTIEESGTYVGNPARRVK